jgi:hypothetical protein
MHTVIYVDATTRANGFVYPPKWANNQELELAEQPAYTGTDLLQLAGVVGAIARTEHPTHIICGSRGSQVTIGKVWQHFWRGPTLLLNGGCLTSQTRIPSGVYPVVLTFGKDYFQTSDRAYVQSVFAAVSAVEGVHLHAPGEWHMPTLQRTELAAIVSGRYDLPGRFDVRVLQPGVVRPVHRICSHVSSRPFVLPRTSPTHEEHWASGTLESRSRVHVLDSRVDKDGHGMVYVCRVGASVPSGWVYTRNVEGL